MQLGDKKLIVQRASIGAKNSTLGENALIYWEFTFSESSSNPIPNALFSVS